jgi:hypothetical protein
MAYNSKNKLKLMFFVREYYLQKQRVGLTKKKIHENINIVCQMSISTLNNYLDVNVKKEIKDLGIMPECNLYAQRLITILNNLTKNKEQ